MIGDRDIRSELPSVDRILQESQDLVSRWGHQMVSEAIREHLCEIRESVNAGQSPDWSILAIHSAINTQLSASDARGIRPVINLSGIVLHTNLGRACLPAAAAEAACQAAMFPNNLEYDLETGKRGNRDSHVESLICELTGSEAAEGRDSDLRRLATELRKLPRPVIGRIHDGRLLLDLRCLDCQSLFLQQLPQLRAALSC